MDLHKALSRFLPNFFTADAVKIGEILPLPQAGEATPVALFVLKFEHSNFNAIALRNGKIVK